MMAIWADNATVVDVGMVLSGAFIGNNNTLITEAVMGAAPVERPVASAAYSFVRFSGGASARTSHSSCSACPRTCTCTHRSGSGRSPSPSAW